MADIAKLVVALEAQSAQFQKELQRANKTLERFESRANKSLGTVKKLFGGFAVGAAVVQGIRSVSGAVGELVAEADNLKDLSSQIGISVESLSTLGKAGEQFGVSAEGMNQSLIKLNKSIAAVSGGNKNLTQSFQEIGVSVRNDVTGNLKTTEQVLADVADAFRTLPDGPLKTAKALEIFGKAGAQLIPFLNEGSAGIQELQEQIKRLGGEISTNTANAADEFGDKLANLKTAFGGLGREIADSVLPKLGSFFDLLASGASKFRDFIDTTPQERVQELTRDIEILQQKIAVTPDFLGGTFVKRLAEARKELAELRSEGGLFKDLLPGLTAELNAAGIVAQEKLATGLKAAEEAGKRAADAAKQQGEEQRRAIESAYESLSTLNSGLTEQVNTFGLSNAAVLEYRLTLGDLSETVQLLGDRGRDLADSSLAQARALDELNAAAEEQKQLQESQRRESEEIVALQRELLPLISGLDAATLEYSESVNKLNEAYSKAAITSDQLNVGLEASAKKLQETQDKAKDATSESVVFAEEAARGIQDAFADFFFDPFDKGLKGLLDSTINTLNRIAAEITASALADLLFGKQGGQSGGGFGGILGKVFGVFGSAGGGGSTPTAGGSTAFGFSDGFSGFRASGGPVFAGGSYVVGEDGPELFTPGRSGMISSNDEMGGNKVTININVSTPTGRLSQESLEQLQTRVGLATRRSTRRNA